MKRTYNIVCICILLAIISATSSAQKLSFGEYTGVNFSNLHGNLLVNKWLPKTGQNTGLFVEYNFSKSFSLQAEASYLTHYYEMKNYSEQYTGPIYYDDSFCGSSSNSITYPYYSENKLDFSFLRFPLFVKYKTPTRLQLGLGGGMFYSVLLNDDVTKAERDAAKKEDRRIYPPKYDWGYLFSADLSYPITKDIRFFVTGRLTSGQKVFVESIKGRNGSSELGFGLKYTPGSRKENINNQVESGLQDSSATRFYIRPVAGPNLGWNSSSKKAGNYSAKIGSTIGAIFDYRLNKSVSLQSGILFERKGYALSDSSLYYHRVATDERSIANKVDSKVELDYMTIPVNLKFSFGNPITFYFDFGLYTGFKVNALVHGTAIRKYSSSSSYTLQKININDAVEGYYHDVDFGYQTGLGFQFPFRKNLKFDLGMVYSASFSPIINKTDENTSGYFYDDVSIKNGTISFQLGLQIPINR